jgi:hypothetical protein
MEMKRCSKKKKEGKFSNALDWVLDIIELGYYGIRGIVWLVSKIFH